jgi:hypothetical protein
VIPLGWISNASGRQHRAIATALAVSGAALWFAGSALKGHFFVTRPEVEQVAEGRTYRLQDRKSVAYLTQWESTLLRIAEYGGFVLLLGGMVLYARWYLPRKDEGPEAS